MADNKTNREQANETQPDKVPAEATNQADKGKTDEVKAEIYVGVQVEINKKTVDLMPKIPINKTKEYGIEFELPRPLEIGKLGMAIKSIAIEDLGMKEDSLAFLEKPDFTGIKPFDNLITKVKSAELTIRALYYKQYPKEDEGAAYFEKHPDQKGKAGQSEYLFAASASCPALPDKEGDFFKFNGLFVVIAKGIKQERVTQVLEESIKGVQAALPASQETATSSTAALLASQETATSSTATSK